MAVLKWSVRFKSMIFTQRYTRFVKDTPQRLLFRGILMIFILILGFLFFWWNQLPPQLPLFYSLPWGSDQLGTPLMLLEYILGSGVLFLINTIIAMYLVENEPFFSRMIFGAGVGIAIL